MTSGSLIKNIVLVHGTWIDGSSWRKVIPILEKSGYNVISVQLALHSLNDDINTVKRAINFINGSTILVGHSYGGLVITNAAYGNPEVKGLVYLAAFAPDEGQSMVDFVDSSKFPKGFLKFDNEGFSYIDQEMFHQIVCQDIDLTEAKVLAATQKPTDKSIPLSKSGPPAWKHLPTWYQISENDLIIPPEIENMFAKQINANIVSLPSSHLSPLSHPDQIAQFIIKAAIN